MSTYYYLSRSTSIEPFKERGWKFLESQSSEFHLIGCIEIEGAEYYIHFYLDEDTMELTSFDRYSSNYPGAVKLVNDLLELGYVYNDMDAEKVVYDEYKLQDLLYERIEKEKNG